MEVKEMERLLALKVMRLKRPSLFTTLPLTSDERDLPGDLFNVETQDKIGGVDGLELCSLGQLLMLPQSFGNIYLGETFSSYISVHNNSKETVRDVFVQVDLQIGSQRIPLSITTCNTTTAELAPEQSVDDIIHHEVKEIGDHVLVFAVSYTTQAEEKMYFRKFFKFQVLKPLDVKTKFYNAEDFVSDKVYLEAQVQNITLTPICLQKVALEPSSLFNVVQLNNLDKKETSPSIFGSVDALNPMDSRQYLYCLNPKKETRANQKALKGVTNIGKLDIVWRSNMGEKGRLQTSQLQRMAPGYGDIRFTIEELPHEVTVEEPFTITCRVVNSCERKVNLVLVLDSTCSSGLYWIGLSGHSVGELEPDSHFDLTLQLVPIQLGLQTISGIRLVDTFLKRTYDYDELAQVFVKSPDTPLLESKRSSNDRLT